MTTSFESAAKEKKDYFEAKRSKGYGVGLYRNKHDAKVAGVCSGLAEYVEMDKGLLRIIALVSVFFTSGASLFLYALMWLALAPRPLVGEPDDALQDAG